MTTFCFCSIKYSKRIAALLMSIQYIVFFNRLNKHLKSPYEMWDVFKFLFLEVVNSHAPVCQAKKSTK